MAPPSFSSSQTPHSEDSHGVPIAFASRDVTVKVKINQSETLPGPKLEVEGFVGSLHLLISPQQLSMLLEMATGIANKGTDGWVDGQVGGWVDGRVGGWVDGWADSLAGG